MNKIVSFIILAVVTASIFTGCGQKSDGGTVSTDGSTSMEKVIGALGKAFEQEYDGITVVVNPKNAVNDLSVEDIAKIYKGEITNWKDVGGKDGSYVVQRPFVLVTKEDKNFSESAQKFFDYVTSSDASDIISKAGVVPAK